MKTQYISYFIFFLFSSLSLQAQNLIKGKIFAKGEHHNEALVAANIYWLENNKGTTSDNEGNFALSKSSQNKKLVVSYIGYLSDTLLIGDKTYIEAILMPTGTLDEIQIKGNKEISLEPMHSELLTVKELQKAACCNLSESFETNASIEVGQTDAVSGSKQLKMLGLDGIYAQIMTEKMGYARGLLSRNGMNFIPGTWLKSIDINKGAGSVTDGYESFTGQINAELAKPENSEKWLLNLYANQGGRSEINSNHAFKISDKWSTGLLLHHSNQFTDNDGNKDGFLDIPKYYQINALNRWKYDGENLEAQIGAHFVYDNRLGGTVAAPWKNENTLTNPYGAGSEAKSLRIWSKTGFISAQTEGRSLGIILSGNYNTLSNYWGLNSYDGEQKNFNATAIFQTPVGAGDDLKTGFSFVLDNYKQNFHQKYPSEEHFDQDRNELVGGVFAEYTFNRLKNFTAVGGLRYDRHNLYGDFFLPRLHLKYEFSENTILRFSAGRGMRTANIFVEYGNYLASSRRVQAEKNLLPESAWNMGGNFTHKFFIGERSGVLSFDFYRTDFQNQIIADLESKDFSLSFYNLKGESFANSFQTELKYEIFKGFDINVAYKYYDVKATYGDMLLDVPFISKHRGFVNLAYQTENEKWLFDFTAQYYGSKRLPKTAFWQHSHGGQTEGYVILHGQITRNWEKFSLYIGTENLTNFMQHEPIVAADNPYSEKFDAGMIWAPVMGRMTYIGMRFSIK